MSDTIADIDKLISENESRILSPPSKKNAIASTKKFDEIYVICAIAGIAIFIIAKVFFDSWFTQEDEFGEVTFNKKKYVGVCGLVTAVVSTAIYLYKRK